MNNGLQSDLKNKKKSKKTKMIIIICCIAFLAALVCYVCVALSGNNAMTSSDLSDYDKKGILAKFGDDLDTNFTVFPDDISNECDVKLFDVSLKQVLFDTNGRIILACNLHSRDSSLGSAL